jgi:hypothetical protein
MKFPALGRKILKLSQIKFEINVHVTTAENAHTS